MAYNTAEPRAEYSANAGQTEFDFVFKIFLTSDLKVYLTPFGQISNDDTDILTENVDYTVSINGDNGGTMTLINPASEDDTLVLIRDLPVKRDYEYQQGGDLSADTLNDDQDYQTYIMSDKESSNNRFLEVPKSAINVQTKLPSIIPNKFLKWNAEGTKIEYATISPDDLLYPAIGITPHSMITQYLSERYVSKNNDLYISTTGTDESPNVGNDPFSNDENWSAIGLTHVTTMAKFRSLKKPPKKVWLTGYHTKNDGAFGSNFYRLKGLRTTEIDNSGSIIVITIGGVDYVYELQYAGAINIKWFGAKGDWNGTTGTNDTVAIQNAIKYAINNNQSIKNNDSNSSFLITETILIPVHQDSYSNIMEIDFGGCTFATNNDITIFESAYYVGGVLTTNIGTTELTSASYGTILKNFCLKYNNDSIATTKFAMRIQDWHQGCFIDNISVTGYIQACEFTSCFYTNFGKLITTGAKVSNKPRIVWKQNNNLMTIKNCVAVDANIGYEFQGLVDAVIFENNSIEGVDIGVNFTGEVRSFFANGNYAENFTDCIFKFNSYAYNAVIDNNYVSFNSSYANSCVYKYLPSPANNIVFRNSNNLNNWNGDLLKIQQTLTGAIDNSLGQNGNIIELRSDFTTAGVSTAMLLDGSEISTRTNLKQTIEGTYHKANVVNNFAIGNYTGAYTAGFINNNKSGFVYISSGSNSFYLDTLISNFEPDSTTRIYINIKVSWAGDSEIIIGEYINGKFYRLSDTGYAYYSSFTIIGGNSLKTGCYRFIKSGFPATVTDVSGEIRLI